jgi:hypothetical protein
MSYKVKLRKHNPRGQVLGELGPFTTQKLALKQAQVVADRGDLANGILVTVEKTPKRRKNTSSRSYKGHKIKGKTGNYTVDPYGYEFPTLKAAKAWLDKHVRDAYPKPKKATTKRKNSASYRIVEGWDHYSNKPLYHVTGITNDYVGEWHTLKRDAQAELKGLLPKKRKRSKPRKNGKFKRGDRVEAKDKTSGWGRIYKYDGEIFRVLGDDEYSVRFDTMAYGPPKHLHVHGSDLKPWIPLYIRDKSYRKNTKPRKNRASTVTYEVYTSRGGKGIRDTSGPFSKRQANKIAKEFVTTPSGVKMRKHPGGRIHKDFKRYGIDWAVVVPTASRRDWELQPALTTRKKLIGPTTYQQNQLGVVDFHPPHGNPKSHGPSCPCPKCNPAHPKVKIQRKGYKRKGYWMTTSTGKRTYVKPTYIAATEFKITDPGRPGVRSFGAKSAGEGYKANPPRKSKRPTKKEIEARRYMKPLITREGKLGGPGYTKRTVAARRKILDKCVKQWGYRSCLGSLLVLLKNSAMKKTARGVITRDKNWLEKKYGGVGSFGPRKNSRMSTYPFYVVDKTSNKILSGWDYREDAKDDVVEIKEFHPRKKVGIYTRKSVERMGINVIAPSSWSNR